MGRAIRGVGVWLMLGATAAPALAQDIYVTGGWSRAWRAPGWYPSLATPEEPPASPVMAATIGAGIWLSKDTAVEGSIGLQQAQSIRWHYNYLFGGNRDELTTDRDIPIVGTLHVAPLRGHRVSAEFVIGGGMNLHRALSYMAADCGSGSIPTPCVPVASPQLNDNLTTREWLVTFGGEVPLRVSPRLEIAPSVRISRMTRRDYLTGDNHRGPYPGGATVPGFGVSVRYLIHGSPTTAAQRR